MTTPVAITATTFAPLRKPTKQAHGAPNGRRLYGLLEPSPCAGTSAGPISGMSVLSSANAVCWGTIAPMKLWRRKGQPQFDVGSRVIVRQDPNYGPGPWPAEPAGRIVAYPDGAAFAEVPTVPGVERSWWVVFDEPQLDVDGDGPYRESQVLQRYLESAK